MELLPKKKTDEFSGARVKMSGHKLRQQCLVVPESTVLVVCYRRGHWQEQQDPNELELFGHVFATVWG